MLVGLELCVGSHSQAEFAQCLLRLKQRMKGDLEGEKAKWVYRGVGGWVGVCVCCLHVWVCLFSAIGVKICIH